MKLPRRFPLEMESDESGGSVHPCLQSSGPTIKFQVSLLLSDERSVRGPHLEAYKGTTNINNATRADERWTLNVELPNIDCDISTRVGPNHSCSQHIHLDMEALHRRRPIVDLACQTCAFQASRS